MVLTTLYTLSIRSHLKPGVSANKLSSCGIGLGTSMIMSVDNFLRKLVPCLPSLHQPNWLACFLFDVGYCVLYCSCILEYLEEKSIGMAVPMNESACKKQTSILHCCHMNNYCLLLSLLSIFIIILSYNYSNIYIFVFVTVITTILSFIISLYHYDHYYLSTYDAYIYISILHHVNHCSPAWTTIIRGTQVLPPLSMACVVDFLLHQEVESTKQHQESPRSTGLEHSTSVQLQAFFVTLPVAP